MEGLEISIQNFKKVFDNDFGRIDAEFFRKYFIDSEYKLKSNAFKKISEIAIVTDGEHGSPDLDENSGIIYLSGHNVKENYIDFENVRYCSEKLHLKNLRSSVKLNNVLISIVGTVGKSSIVDINILANTDRNVATIKDISSEINPYYLSVYLNSKYGKYQTERFSTGNVQPLLNLSQVKSIILAIPNLIFQNQIESVLKVSGTNRKSSQETYQQAEQILLKEIGLNNFEPSKEAVNVKSFRNSFGNSGRLDAEYYQVKYEDVITKIKSQKHDTLNNIVNISKSIEPGSNYYSDDETGLPFMRVADFNKFGLSEPNKRLTLDFVKDNKAKITDLMPKKGTILFSKDGSVGVAYHLRADFEGVNSGAILHFKVKDESVIIPEYLTLALNSKVVKMQAERDAGGSIILHWRVGEIENVIVPIIDFDKQQQIAELVEQSFKLKKQSEQLLEIAKQAVEIAIEQNEAVSLDFIAKNAVL